MLTFDRPRVSPEVMIPELEDRAEIARDAAAEPIVARSEIAAGLRELADLIENDYMPAPSSEQSLLSVSWFAKNPDAVDAFAASRGIQSNHFEHEGLALTTTWLQLGGVIVSVSNRERVTR